MFTAPFTPPQIRLRSGYKHLHGRDFTIDFQYECCGPLGVRRLILRSSSPGPDSGFYRIPSKNNMRVWKRGLDNCHSRYPQRDNPVGESRSLLNRERLWRRISRTRPSCCYAKCQRVRPPQPHTATQRQQQQRQQTQLQKSPSPQACLLLPNN